MSPRITYSTRCVAVLCIAVLCIFLAAPIASASNPSDDVGANLPYEDTGLVVDCEFTECHFGHIFELANRIVKVLIWIAVTGIALVIIWHGAILAMNGFFPGEYQGKVKGAQKAIRTALFGLVLALSAYLIVDFFFRQLRYKDVDDLFTAPPAPASISKAPASVTLVSDGDGIDPHTTTIPHRTLDTTPTISFIAVSGATTTAEYRIGTTGRFTTTGVTITGSGDDTARSVILPELGADNTYQVKITQDEDGADGPAVPTSTIYRFTIDSEQTSTTSPTTSPTGCDTCVSLNDSPRLPHKSKSENGCYGRSDGSGSDGDKPCFLNEGLKNRLHRVFQDEDAGELNWRITESWPPTIRHQCGCHNNGTCADVNFHPNLAGQELADAVNLFIDTARGNNIKAVYEVPTQAQKTELVHRGVRGTILVLGHVSPHFSVYMNEVGCRGAR